MTASRKVNRRERENVGKPHLSVSGFLVNSAADLDSSSKKSDDSQESSEPIRDPDPEEKKSGTMAQSAAAFSVSGERVDMHGSRLVRNAELILRRATYGRE